jgi:hypothetical protein
MSSCSMDCKIQCVFHLLEEIHTHASQDGGAVSVVSSDSNREIFSNIFFAC